MNIAVVVQGRFHAFDLVRTFSAQGHRVTLMTNYPEWAARKYDIGSAQVRSYWQHGLASRIGARLHLGEQAAWDSAFGRWAAKEIGRGSWDLIHCWSGVALELIRRYGSSRGKISLMRGSSHIRTQERILAEEEQRAGTAVERPSERMIEREEEEYQRADQIVVLSGFAYRSFVEEGVQPSKLRLLPLGANCASFRPSEEILEERCRRIRSGLPLRVLYVGGLYLRKGMRDALDLVRGAKGRFEFRFVGPVTQDSKREVKVLRTQAQVLPKQPQAELHKQYAWADLFIFPTLEDGFAAVLGQAQASALPILCTSNCGGPDLIREGETGWILPIRSPGSFLRRLEWCDSHRAELISMIQTAYHGHQSRDWRDVARDFESICMTLLSNQPFAGVAHE